MSDLPNADKILANAVAYLIEGQELYEASILLLCKVDLEVWREEYALTTVMVDLIGNRAVYEIIQNTKHPSTVAILNAFNAALPPNYYVEEIRGRIELKDYGAEWRSTLLEIIEGKRPLNQCVPIQEKPRHSWENLFFRSPVEITIAKALDKYRVLFLPNCMARLGLPGSRENREADFLVCYEGRWGILEINGDAYHMNAAKDHNRSRLFKIHGIRVFEPYEARRCMKEPDSVVREFLELLKKNAN
jgi:hypothetical protein